MFWSMVPLLVRMGLVHVVLIYGTNNTTTEGLTHEQILHRETGSKVVLAARIFYAAFIWIAKLTVLEFLKRTIGASWARSYEIGLRLIYGFLVVTFIGVVIGTLSECQPFGHYWQVVPDPGPRCREGIVQLVTMGVCDIVTDIVLVIFPIPVVLAAKSMTLLKKLSLISLFLLSIILIAITAYRIPSTISRKSSQQFRSLIASLEILAAAGVANAVIIGSFIRDKGVKKAKFEAAPAGDGNSVLMRSRTKSITFNHWGSDEDLVRGMGVALPPLLRSSTNKDMPPRPAQMAPPGQVDIIEEGRKNSEVDKKWDFKRGSQSKQRRGSDSSLSTISTDIKLHDLREDPDDPESPGAGPEPLAKQMSFFDVGGLVDKPAGSPANTSREASVRDTALASPPVGRGRAGSKAFLTDIGGFLSRHKEEEEPTAASGRSLTPMKSPERRRFSRSPRPFSRSPRPSKVLEPEPEEKADDGPDALDISDAGGLLRL